MRNVDSHLLGVKMDEAVTHYINSHQTDEGVHVDANSLALNVQDDEGRVTIMHSQNFIPLCRPPVTVGEHETEGQWGEELLDPEGRLAAIMAHITAQHPRGASQHPHHKESTVRTEVDTSVMLDNSMRLFNGQTLDQSADPIVVEVPHLPALPALQGMKRCQETDWYHNKTKAILKDQSTDPIVVQVPHLPPLPRLQGLKRCQEADWINNKPKTTLKNEAAIVSDEASALELGPGASAQCRHSKKSLPHKKRISRKLRRNNGGSTPHQDIVVISCAEDGQQEEILPDSFVASVQPQDHLPDDAHHMTHEIRPVLLCQLCGEFYGEDQLKFYQHLKQHYEPHGTIIIENPVPDLAIDKMTTSCIVDNVAALPDSIVELSLENTVPKTMYQSIDKHILYSTSDKTLNYANHKVQYSVASMDKEPTVVHTDAEKNLYETLDKLDLYNCSKCNKSFRKQKQCEAHIKEAHSNAKLEDMAEFSEPEDLMEGIHVSVDEGGEHYEQTLLPHLTVENGHVHQEHARQWYLRAAGYGAARDGPDAHQLKVLKEEVLQRILETDVPPEASSFPDNMIPEPSAAPPHPPPHPHPPPPPPPPAAPAPPADDAHKPPPDGDKKKPQKRFECPQCARVFMHRNSLLYHLLSHSSKQQVCRECGKGFYTLNALKVHKRVHNGDKPCKCDICGRDFRQWSDLKYHKISIHSNQKLFKCEFCGKEFARKYSLDVHRRIHTGERNYKCDYCAKTFRASSYRLSHMRTHTGDKPYKCSQCDKCFRVGADLRRHLIMHEKVRNRLEEQKNKTSKPQKETKRTAKPEEPEKTEFIARVMKKIAVASTTKPPAKSPDKKTPNKRRNNAKKGAPNVTIDQMDSDYTNNVEVFDTRQDAHYKFKEVYDNGYKEELDFGKQMIGYKEDQGDRELAMLRPMFRNGICDTDVIKGMFRSENTDGKMQIFTHVEKTKEYIAPVVSNSQLSDMRQLDREVRSDIQGENIENGFIERLTALYNIPAV